MEAYYSPKNTARIGPRLIKGVNAILENLWSVHEGGYGDGEKQDIVELQKLLDDLELSEEKVRREAEIIATQTAKLTWKITRNTRPNKDIRRELAGISKRIGELMENKIK